MSLVTTALRALHAIGYEDVRMTINPDGSVVAVVSVAARNEWEPFRDAMQGVARERGLQCVTTQNRAAPLRAFVAHWFGG